jgi:hypothetical protein
MGGINHVLVTARYQVMARDAIETGIDFQDALGLFAYREQT